MKNKFLLVLLGSILICFSCNNREKSVSRITDAILIQDVKTAESEFNKILNKSKDDALFVLDSCFKKGAYLLAHDDTQGADIYIFAISNIVNHNLQFFEYFENYVLSDTEFDVFFTSLSKLINQSNYQIIIDSCLTLGIYNFKNKNYSRAENIGKHTIELIKTFNYPINQLLVNYLSYFNNLEEVFDFFGDWYLNDLIYSDLSLTLISLESKNRVIHNAKLERVRRGYTTEIWLFPLDNTKNFNIRTFGIETFNPLALYKLSTVDVNTINGITPDVFIRNVKSNVMFFTNSMTNNLNYNWIPELQKDIDGLKKKTDFEIAGQRNNFINKMLEVRNIYKKANLKYIANWYKIEGRGYVSKSNYDVNKQTLKIHMYLEKGNYEDLYVGTVEVPITLEEAHQLFAKNNTYEPSIDFIVSPGITRSGLGIAGGGVSAWNVPSFYLAKEPIISITNSKGFNIKLQTVGWKGNIWAGASTRRWDLHTNTRPRYDNIRIINSKRL